MNKQLVGWVLAGLTVAVVAGRPSLAKELEPSVTELIIQLADAPLQSAAVRELNEDLRGTTVFRRLFGSPQTYLVATRSEREREQVERRLADNSMVAIVQPNYLYRAYFASNDPLYPQQWNFSSVRVGEAWDLDTTAPLYGGDPGVTVAVLDSGFTAGPDHAATRLAAGKDYINGDDDPRDDNGHGTHVAGTIVQSTNNGTAGAGIAFESTLLPIKVLDAGGVGSTAAITQGVNYARQNGADVINLSLGGMDDDPVLHAAVIAAKDEGIVLVAATGNENATSLSFPAAYEEVIAVGAIRYDNTKTSYSNSGTGIDLVAPGGDLTVDQNGDGQVDGIVQQTCTAAACTAQDNFLYAGTSQAAPHVGAAAALLLAAGADGSQVQSTLQATAVDLGAPGYDTQYGYGRLDIAAALLQVTQDATPPTGTIAIEGGVDRTRVTSVALALTGADATGVASMAFTNDGVTFSSPEAFATTKLWDLADPATGGSAAEGLHTVSVQLLDAKGNATVVSDTITLDSSGPAALTITGYRTSKRAAAFSSRSPVSVARPTFHLSATDDAGIEGYYVAWTKLSSVDPQAKGKFQANATYTPKSVKIGTWYLHVQAKDRVGNLSATATFIFRRGTRIVLHAARSNGRRVRVYNPKTGKLTRSLDAYAKGFRAGVNVAAGDVNADGRDEVIAAPVSGRVDLAVLTARGKVLKRFRAYPDGFRGGASVAVGDLDGDGQAEIVTVPASGAAHVGVFSGTGEEQARFFAFPTSYRGGATIAVADLDGDAKAEILVAQAKKNSTVAIFSGTGEAIRTFTPFGAKASFGSSLAASDVDGDGKAEILVSSLAGSCRVRILRPSGSLKKKWTIRTDGFANGCTVSVGDVDADGKDDVILGSRLGDAVLIRRYDGKDRAAYRVDGFRGVQSMSLVE